MTTPENPGNAPTPDTQPPSLPPPADTGSARQAAARPTWTYFLTPIAVLLGSFVIGGFVLLGWGIFGGDDGTGADAQVAVSQPITEGGVSSSVVSPTPATSVRAVLTGYVESLGLDEQQWLQCASDQATADIINNQIKEGAQLGVTGTPTFFVNNKMIVGAQPFSVLQEVIDAELKGSPTTIDSYSPQIQAMANQDPPYFKILDTKPDITGAHIEGDKDAKVMIVEFSDFQCPFCERWYTQDLPQLRQMLGSDVALAFLNFPIPQLHPNAGIAAVAAQCAADQGKFWPMHDMLFDNQSAWDSLPQS